MKVLILQAEYEKLFPQSFFNLSIYKKVIQEGVITRLSNLEFEDIEKIRKHLILYHSKLQ